MHAGIVHPGKVAGASAATTTAPRRPKESQRYKQDLPTPSLLWTCRLQKTDAASISHEWYQQFNNSRTEDDLKKGD